MAVVLAGVIGYLVAPDLPHQAASSKTLPVTISHKSEVAKTAPKDSVPVQPRDYRQLSSISHALAESNISLPEEKLEAFAAKELQEASVGYPLALGEPTSGLIQSEEQLTAFNTIRAGFVRSIVSSNQNYSTPAYRDVWENASQFADEQFRALFGDVAFNQREIEAVREGAITR